MTYRDDRDADRARIEALETELAGANKRIAELEGKSLALVLASATDSTLALASTRPSAAKKWLGASLELELARDFEGSFPVDKFEDLVETCRTLTREPGRTELLKSSMTWSLATNPKSMGPFVAVTVTVRDGVTKLVVGDRLGQAAAAIYGGVGGGVGGGAIILPILAAAAMPILTPAIVVGWLGGTMWGCRALFKRIARRRAAYLQRLFDALADQIANAIAEPAKT